MTALPSDAVADLYKLVAELEQRLESSFAAHDEAIAREAATAQENARLQNELSVAREHENATADILKAEIISDLPSAVRLSVLWTRITDTWASASTTSTPGMTG